MTSGAIRNPEAYAAAAVRRRTERFDDCFPRGCRFGDIDSFLEINGHMLFVEWKLGHQAISTGQRIAYSRLAAIPMCTVLCIWTDEGGTITKGLKFPDPHARQTTEDKIRMFFKKWAREAEGK